MKAALCVGSYGDLQALVAGQTKTVDVRLVDREICDKPENNFRQLVPYVVFYHMDVSAGKLKFVQFARPEKSVEGSEEKISGGTSIGFGTQFVDESEFTVTETVVGENNDKFFRMTTQNIIDSAIATGLKEVNRQLGMDVVADAGAVVDLSQIAFFNSEAPGVENMVRVGIAIPVKLTSEQYDYVVTNAKLIPEEISQVGPMGINIDLIVEQMDITPVLKNVIEDLVGKYDLEAWSAMMFNFIARKEIAELLKEINYNDIVALVNGKRAAMAQFEAEQLALRQKEAEAAAQNGEASDAMEGAVTSGTTTETIDAGDVEQTGSVLNDLVGETTPAVEVEQPAGVVEETADQSKEG